MPRRGPGNTNLPFTKRPWLPALKSPAWIVIAGFNMPTSQSECQILTKMNTFQAHWDGGIKKSLSIRAFWRARRDSNPRRPDSTIRSVVSMRLSYVLPTAPRGPEVAWPLISKNLLAGDQRTQARAPDPEASYPIGWDFPWIFPGFRS